MLDALLVPTEPVPAEFPIPGIRWSLREGEYSPDGEQLIDVVHYVAVDGHYESRVSVVEATPSCGGLWWSLYTLSGEELDESSEILLEGELRRDARGKACAYHVDPHDMARELARLLAEQLTAEAA